MKKKIFLVMASLIFSSALYAVDLDFKGGVMHPTSPNKFGLDTALAFNYDLNNYFLIGMETGFGWVNWAGIGEGYDGGYNGRDNVTLYPSHKANLYHVPLLATFTAQANLIDCIPYISAGLGYGWAWYRQSGANDSFHNYEWQLLTGLKWKFKSRVLFITEVGFRSGELRNSDKEIMSMTGWFGRVGICIPFRSSSSSSSSSETRTNGTTN